MSIRVSICSLSSINPWKDPKKTSLRRAAILKVEKDNSTHLALIKNYLGVKYKMDFETATAKQLCEAQNKTLITDIRERTCHKRYLMFVIMN